MRHYFYKERRQTLPKGLPVILSWTIGIPAAIITSRIGIDYGLGRDIEWLSYVPLFLGTAAAGLVFAGPLHYAVHHLKKNE
ncbi:hypothetical protein [Salibacterium halotolerans]|uniref:Uncharacterized protein n=1 Tax=Salibacterium halotolerans TaxID=1884432 RepID=A0A1I5S2X0_9BACI|nr:hypothetical protein [Salibacterium halotolerans]SFP65074.1 hypothetical protein SAMN05518683_10828 [Salibacterium halotolerans]